jgi:uncharacterized membrane protein
MEELLHEFARCVALAIEGIAIVIIAVGSARALLDSFAPSWNELGRLAAVAAICTFLSYFLDHEMETTRRLQQARVPSESDPGRPQQSA